MNAEMSDFQEELRSLFLGMLPLYVPRAHQRSGTKVQTKVRADQGDVEPVIDLDSHALTALRDVVRKHFPEDGTLGEEDKKNPDEITAILTDESRCWWTIDGLDGTWGYIRGTNSYGAMLSRRQGNRILQVVMFRPVDSVLRGTGLFLADEGGTREWCGDCGQFHRLQTAAPGTLERTTVLLEGPSKNFFRPPLTRLGERVTTRASLSSCVAATLVAQGTASAVVTKNNKPWDNWPMIGLIEGAGGIVADYRGEPRRLNDCGDIVAAANPDALNEILALLNQ